MTTLYLFLDDERIPIVIQNQHEPLGWCVFRDIDSLKQTIIQNIDRPDIRFVISLDHDLGENPLTKQPYPTGYDFLNWLEQTINDRIGARQVIPYMDVSVHSQNPVGRQNMNLAIAKVLQMMDDYRNELSRI